MCMPALILEQLAGVPASLGLRRYNIYRLHGWPLAYQIRWAWEDHGLRLKSSPWPWVDGQRVEVFPYALYFDMVCLVAMLVILWVAFHRVSHSERKMLQFCVMLMLAGVVLLSLIKVWRYRLGFDIWDCFIEIPHRVVFGYLLAELATWVINLVRRCQVSVRDLLLMAALTAVAASVLGARLKPVQGRQSLDGRVIKITGGEVRGLLFLGRTVLVSSSPQSSTIERLPYGSAWLGLFLREHPR